MAFQQNETVGITLKIEGDEARNKLSLLEKEAIDLNKALKEVPKGSAEWQTLTREIHKNQDAQKALKTELGLTGLTYRELQNEARILNKELSKMTPGTAEFISKSKQLAEVTARAKEVKAEMSGISTALDEPTKKGLWQKMVSGATSAGSAIKQAFGLAAIMNIQSLIESVINFGKEAVLKAAETSDAFGDIRKATGMTTKEVFDLNAEIRKIDTRTAQKDLLDIAKVGGQIGIAKDEMMGFVESVDKAVVALGDEFSGGAEEVSATLGVMSKLFKETKDLQAGKAINDIGSAINELGAAGSATGPVVSDFTTRVGQLGKLAPAIDQTLGLGAALQELGLTAEIGAGGLSNILLGAAKATKLYADQIGMTEKEFKKLINSDPNEVILRLAKSFKGMPIDQVVKQMNDLGIKSQEATKVMMLLSDKTDMVREKQLLASKAMKEGTSLTAEFSIKNETAAAKLEKAGKVVDLYREKLGNALIPVVLALTAGFVGLVKTIGAIPEFIEENKEAFIALGVAIVSLNTANIAAAASTLYYAAVEKGRAIATQSVTAAQWLLNAAMTANPIGLVVAGVSLLVGGFTVLYNHSEKVRAGVAALWAGLKATGTVIAEFGKALINLDFAGMAKAISEGGKTIGNAFMKGYQDKLNSEAAGLKAAHKKTIDEKVDISKKGASQAAANEILIAAGGADTITKAEQKELDKRKAAKEKLLESYRTAEDKYDEQVRKDREKALDLLAKMEAENEQATAVNTLEIQESKIREIARKRLADIEKAKLDEAEKARAIEAINVNSETALEKARRDFREKRIKEEEEAAKKRLETENFIREQEMKAEMMVFDWREMQARGNASKLAAVKKERVDAELALTKQAIEAEIAAEQQKAIALTHDAGELAVALSAIETRYNTESLMAVKKAADDKKTIDQDLHDTKVANAKAYSSAFASLLAGDVSGFMAAASQIVAGHKAAWQERLSADMGAYETGAQAAQAAVNFLNDLAQKKAEKAIAEAKREVDAKIATLTTELQVTESLITASSNYVKDLKEAETQRLTELQRILTSETSTEEQKRDALKKYYSEQLQQMKAAEEAKIQELQRLANQAKTEDEKRAIEEKIRLAEKESEEKIRLATEEAEARAEMIDALQEFTMESTETLLVDAEKSSEKQIQMASDEAEQKAEFKADLEDTIAAENRKARATEMAEKQKAFRAQKKADIATALITGALAVLKALANFFPLNIILAATAAVVTGVQIAKIKNQPEPTFRDGGLPGGFIARGGKHGNIYGDGGIALIDRASGREVGEMEGDEAIISADQTAANMPLINEMFKNARTPGMRNKAVSMETGLQSSYRDGGAMFESPYWKKEMYLFGSKKRKAEQAAKDAEAEAAKAQAEADAYIADMPSADTSAYDGIDGSEPNPSTAESQAAFEASQKQGQMQLELLKEIIETLEASSDANTATGLSLEKAIGASADSTANALKDMGSQVSGLAGRIEAVKNAVNENVGATRGVENAVNNANANGVLHGILEGISNLA
ncbi:hypothetical protein [Dyadobacter sp.]|uniref:hypothetical protein n=1 Tax=Dyadobacter sp. TaxID=1914288 RepID=UPI003F6F81CE